MKFRLVFMDNTWGNADITDVKKLHRLRNMADARALVAYTAESWIDRLYLRGDLESVIVEPLPFPQYLCGFTIEWTTAQDGELINSHAVVLEVSKEMAS